MKYCCNYFINGKCEMFGTSPCCDGIFNRTQNEENKITYCRYDSGYKVSMTEEFQFKMLEQIMKTNFLKRLFFKAKRIWLNKRMLKRAIAYYILVFWVLIIVSSLVYCAIKYPTFGTGLLFFTGLGIAIWTIIWSIMKLSD